MDLKARIREFIQSNFFAAGSLADSDSLLERGVIDSTGVLELIGFIETEYGIKVDDEEITSENLETISAIAAYLERKTTKPLTA